MKQKDKIDQIISLVFSAHRALHEKMDDSRVCKMSPLHMMTLRYIWEKKPLMKEIAEFLSITPPSATSLVNNFIKQGIAKREEDKSDRRIVRIVMTKKGEEYVEKYKNEALARLKKSLGVLSQKDQNQLIGILTKAVKSYKKANG